MGNFNRGGDRGGFRDSRGGGFNRGGGFGGGSRGGFGGERREVTMHDAICDDCKKQCQIPFKPSSDKPVYCSDCFNKRGGPARRDDSAPRRDFGSRPQNDFNSAPARVGGNDDVKKQLESMNVKLDRLISAIEGKVKPVTVSTPVKVEEKKAVAKVAEKTSKTKVAAKKKTTKK
jgi:CxxC-x17-CxxC domain-containing protein